MAFALPDLDTTSVLDVVEENFQNVGLKTYATRMMYIGEHTLPRTALIEHFKETIKGVNSGYCEINVYGLLLVYDSYFLHIVEGSEDTIHRHLRFLFAREEQWIKDMAKLDEEQAEGDVGLINIMADDADKKLERKFFKRLKLIMVFESIKKVLFREWRAITARPPSLVGKLDTHSPLQEHLEQLRICLNKINMFCEFADAEPNLRTFEGLSAVDPKVKALPEVALLDFLLQSPHMLDLREAASMHRRVDDYTFYFEQVWPLPTHYTPRHLYKLKVDDSFVQPLPVMPWENVKKEVEEDENRNPDDESAGSSDS